MSGEVALGDGCRPESRRVLHACLDRFSRVSLCVSFLIQGSAMTESHERRPLAERAARVHVIALRAAQFDASRSTPRLYTVFPSEEAVGEDTLTRVIGALPKPVECNARPSVDVLAIRCETLTDPGRLEYQQALAEEAERSFVAEIRYRYAGGLENPLVAVRGAEDSIVVDLEAVREWFRAYMSPGDVALEPPDAFARSNGAVAVLSLGGGKGRIRVIDDPLR